MFVAVKNIWNPNSVKTKNADSKVSIERSMLITKAAICFFTYTDEKNSPICVIKKMMRKARETRNRKKYL